MAQETIPAGRNAVCVFDASSAAGAGLVATPVSEANVNTWLGTLSTSTDIANNISSVSLNNAPVYASTNTRGRVAGGYTSQKPVMKQGEVSFEVLWRTSTGSDGDTSFEQRLIDAADSLGEMALGFFDYDPITAPATGDTVQGLCGNFYIGVEKSEADEDVQRFSITATVASGCRWHKITGS